MSSIDFRNPQLYAFIDGKPFSELFGGFKPNGWLKSVVVTMSYGGAAMIKWTIEPPYAEACKFLDSGLINLHGANYKSYSYVTIRFGYLGNPPAWTPVFGGFVTQFPKVIFGIDTTIEFMAFGLVSWSGKQNTNPDIVLKGKNGKEILETILQTKNEALPANAQIPVKFYYDEQIEEARKKGAQNRIDEVPVFVTNRKDKPLDTYMPDDPPITQNVWETLTRLLSDMEYRIVDKGNYIEVMPVEDVDTAPKATFVMYGETVTEKNIFGIDSFDLIVFDNFYLTRWQKVNHRGINQETGKPIDEPVALAGKSANETMTQQTSNNRENTQQYVAACGTPTADGGVILGQGHVNTNMALDASYANVASCDMFGMPLIVPGDNVFIQTAAKVMSGTWRCREVMHTYDNNGWQTSFNFFMPGALATATAAPVKTTDATVQPTPQAEVKEKPTGKRPKKPKDKSTKPANPSTENKIIYTVPPETQSAVANTTEVIPKTPSAKWLLGDM